NPSPRPSMAFGQPGRQLLEANWPAPEHVSIPYELGYSSTREVLAESCSHQDLWLELPVNDHEYVTDRPPPDFAKMPSGSCSFRRPNFFIVGAPKCGTTAMANYLSWNPRVFVTTPKEPDYFVRHTWSAPNLRLVPSFKNSLEHYLKLFHNVPNDCL